VTTRRQALKITAIAGISVAFGGGIASGLLRLARLKQVRATRTRMGTRVTVTVVHPDESTARSMVDAAFAEMERLEDILSRHRHGTALDRLNREGVLPNAPDELLTVLRASREYSILSSGAFDSTVAPVLTLYEKDVWGANELPEDADVEAALALVDYREVHIDGHDVRLGRPGMAVTLDGIAKGFIVDRTVDVLTAAGAERVMVEAAGDVASSGSDAEEDGWRLGIQDPRDASGILGVVRLDRGGVATSGDYVQSFSDDLSLHHILDPRTGRSPADISGATVMAPSAMEADALSTAVLVLGPERGLPLLERLDGVEGLLVTKAGKLLPSSGFTRRLA
jgi:thiamine biosynthesis lipoprotein